MSAPFQVSLAPDQLWLAINPITAYQQGTQFGLINIDLGATAESDLERKMRAASCLCILTPGVLGPGYFREIAAVLAGGAPDPVKMKEIMLRHGLVPAPQ
jgi:hypothetical protein